MEVFSTITSPVFSQLTFVVWYDQFVQLLSDAVLFETLYTMHKVQPFKLDFLVQLPHPPSREGRQGFELALGELTEGGGFDFLDSPPTVRLVQPYPLVHPYP